MDIFISWSGEKSKQVASLLKMWLPDVIQQVSPWVSHIDINAGARWNNEIQERLAEIKFGIICLSLENVNAPWILFETGALAKTLDDTFVCPYLIDLKPIEIPSGPLTQFQAKSANKDGTWELLLSLNDALKVSALPEIKLKRAFDRCWPEFEEELSKISLLNTEPENSRPVEDKIEEILMIVRELKRFSPKTLLKLDPGSINDLNIIASLHDIGKYNESFQQKSGRINRKKEDRDA